MGQRRAGLDTPSGASGRPGRQTGTLRVPAARPRRVLGLLAQTRGYDAANFITLIASLFVTHPPTRFVA